MRTRFFMIFALILAATAGPLAIVHAQPKPSKKAISIKDMKFIPDSLDIRVGDTVVWTNSDDVDHTVVDAGGAFKSENIKSGKSFSYKFEKAGKFSYSCTYHPRMKGTVTATADDKDAKPAK